MAPGIPTTHCQDYFYLEDNLIFMDNLPCNEVDIPEQQLDNCYAEYEGQYYSGCTNHQLRESPRYTHCPKSSSTPPPLSHLKFGNNEARGQMLGFAYRGCHNEELHTRVHCAHEAVHDEAGAAAQCDETRTGDSSEQDMLSDDVHYIHRCPFKHCSGRHHHINNKQNKHKYNKTLLLISTSIRDEQRTTHGTVVPDNKNCMILDGMETSQLLRINSCTSRTTFPTNSDETAPPPPAAAAAALNLLDNHQSSTVTRSIYRAGHRPLLQEKQENMYETPGSERLATEGYSRHQQHIIVKGIVYKDQKNNCEMVNTTQEGGPPGITAEQVKESCRPMGREGGYVIGTDTRQWRDPPVYGDTKPAMASAAQAGATKRGHSKHGKFYPSIPDEHQVTPSFRKRAIEYIVEQFGGGTSCTNSDNNVSATPSSPSNSEAVSRLYRTVERLEQTVYCAAAHRSKENYMRTLASKLATVYEELQHSHQWQQHAPSRPPAAGAGQQQQQQQQQGCSRPLRVRPLPPSRQHLGAVHEPHESECDGSTDNTMEVSSTSVEQNSCDT